MRNVSFFVLVGIFFCFCLVVKSSAEPVVEIKAKERCAVCGMMVAKFPTWVSQLKTPHGVLMFDGVKDMMAYYLSPESYGGNVAETIENIYVKEYYTQGWIDAKTAYYVVGSDVLGPMGHEFIPFEGKDGAENFMKEHHGEKILQFEDITKELVSVMKGSHKMQGPKMKH